MERRGLGTTMMMMMMRLVFVIHLVKEITYSSLDYNFEYGIVNNFITYYRVIK